MEKELTETACIQKIIRSIGQSQSFHKDQEHHPKKIHCHAETRKQQQFFAYFFTLLYNTGND